MHAAPSFQPPENAPSPDPSVPPCALPIRQLGSDDAATRFAAIKADPQFQSDLLDVFSALNKLMRLKGRTYLQCNLHIPSPLSISASSPDHLVTWHEMTMTQPTDMWERRRRRSRTSARCWWTWNRFSPSLSSRTSSPSSLIRFSTGLLNLLFFSFLFFSFLFFSFLFFSFLFFSFLLFCFVLFCFVLLCYVMLCYVMLCYVMLCYVMLCYVMLCYVMLYVICYIYIFILFYSDDLKLLNTEKLFFVYNLISGTFYRNEGILIPHSCID